jgi:hypothetical protein
MAITRYSPAGKFGMVRAALENAPFASAGTSLELSPSMMCTVSPGLKPLPATEMFAYGVLPPEIVSDGALVWV